MFYVYLLASQKQGTLYVGMTDGLLRRVWEHKIKAVPLALAALRDRQIDGRAVLRLRDD